MLLWQIPTDKIGLVIGPGGRTIKGIRDDTGCEEIQVCFGILLFHTMLQAESDAHCQPLAARYDNTHIAVPLRRPSRTARSSSPAPMRPPCRRPPLRSEPSCRRSRSARSTGAHLPAITPQWCQCGGFSISRRHMNQALQCLVSHLQPFISLVNWEPHGDETSPGSTAISDTV